MEKFQEMLHKLQLECEKARKRPIHRNKQFEIAELGINMKQSKKDRLTIINAWFGNIPITRWYKDSLKYDGLEFGRYNWGWNKLTSPLELAKFYSELPTKAIYVRVPSMAIEWDFNACSQQYRVVHGFMSGLKIKEGIHLDENI